MVVALATALVAGTLVGAATPAAAATPDGYGFAYLDAPSQMIGVPYAPDPAHQFTTNGGVVTVTRTGTGFYTVLFPGLGKPRGIAHVTAVNGSPVWCQLLGYGMSGADEVVRVACVHFGWVLSDSRFTVLFSTSSAPPAAPGAYGYVRSDPVGTVLDSYNSAAGAVSVAHGGFGNYSVVLSGLGAPGQAGGVQVTAVNGGGPARCKVAAWGVDPAGVTVRVRCFDAAGALLDSGWTLSYQRDRAISGAVSPPKLFGYFFDAPGAPLETNGNSVGGLGVNTVVAAGVGLRLVKFPFVGALQDHVQVTAVGPGSQWCGLNTIWGTFGGDAVVRDVICFDGAVLSDQPSLVTYTSRF
jgi:hypothetical protein